MRLPTAHSRAISRGAKTQLRVPVDSRLVPPFRPARRHSGRPATYNAGDILAIDSDQRTYCKIIASNRTLLGTLAPQDALAEGHPTVEEFEIDWIERHEHAWLDRQIEYLVEADVPREEAEETRPAWAKVRYDQHWTSREVWVLEVTPFADIPYLLPGLPDEPEAIRTHQIHRRWDIKAGRKHETAKTEVLAELLAGCATVEERLGVVREEARKRGYDIRSDLRAIDRRINTLASNLFRDAA